MDYRTLLKKYIQLIISEESDAYIVQTVNDWIDALYLENSQLRAQVKVLKRRPMPSRRGDTFGPDSPDFFDHYDERLWKIVHYSRYLPPRRRSE